jgi:subtilisin family serine protease
VAQGADVVNLSVGLPEDLDLIQQAIQSAWTAGVPVYAAAGNRMAKVDFPALLSQTQAVTAVDSLDRKATWASYGTSVDLSAPGVWILGAHPRSPSGVARWSGTSFSTPICAGGFALLRAQFPLDAARDLVRRLEETAVPIDDGNSAFANRIGKGRIDLDAATRVGP